ncbi:hypothetical protein [Ruegeria hyattellae]|uniref:hypothetical protein n=1 Tax=Ruegeria hyattellae TaxID=3233337 RepID=UPI00355C1A2C
MSRLIGVVVVLAALAAVYYFTIYQEPTPTEQLETAAQDAGDAVQDAASALGEAVSDSAQSLTEQAGDTVAAIQEQGAQALEDASGAVTESINNSTSAVADGAAGLQQQGQELIKNLQDEGLLTEAGFDYDKVVSQVEASPLVQVVKDQFIAIVGEIRDAPEQFDAGLDKLKALFQG